MEFLFRLFLYFQCSRPRLFPLTLIGVFLFLDIMKRLKVYRSNNAEEINLTLLYFFSQEEIEGPSTLLC